MSDTMVSQLHGLRVMVAEDDYLISQMIERVLHELGCVVVGPFRKLGEALHAITTTDLDGALLDVQLGAKNVSPVATELALRDIPFILVTGQRNMIGSSAPLGNAPLLTKPFTIRRLEEVMHSTFRLGKRCEPQQL